MKALLFKPKTIRIRDIQIASLISSVTNGGINSPHIYPREIIEQSKPFGSINTPEPRGLIENMLNLRSCFPLEFYFY